MSRRLLGSLLVALTLGSPYLAGAQQIPIHSDLPLWGRADAPDNNRDRPESEQEYWPQHFYNEDDGSFGCSTVVSMGSWRYLARDLMHGDASSEILRPSGWVGLRHFGAFHCGTMIAWDYAEELKDAELSAGEVALFVELGVIEIDGRPKELWAIQTGFVPGSDYLLLSRSPATDGLIRQFDVLPHLCPEQNLRTVGAIDSFLTAYCAINSRADMIALARDMARRERWGTLEWVGGTEDPAH